MLQGESVYVWLKIPNRSGQGPLAHSAVTGHQGQREAIACLPFSSYSYSLRKVLRWAFFYLSTY